MFWGKAWIIPGLLLFEVIQQFTFNSLVNAKLQEKASRRDICF
jgi:hypothetical protein